MDSLILRTIIERALNSLEFRQALHHDSQAALAEYQLSPEDFALVEAALKDGAGDSEAIPVDKRVSPWAINSFGINGKS